MRYPIFISFLSLSLYASSAYEARLQKLEHKLQYYNELERVVDQIETRALRDKIAISPRLRLRTDNFRYTLTKLTTNVEREGKQEVDRDAVEEDGFSKTYNPHISFKLSLTMMSDLGEKTRFVGRAVMSKTSQNSERLCILSRDITAAAHDEHATVDFDRAYFDHSFGEYYTFSAGVLPTSGGMSSNLIENTPRQSLFPSLVFDSHVMGLIMTANLSAFTQSDESFLRVIYGKAFNLSRDSYYYQCNRETIENLDAAGVFVETSMQLPMENTLYAGISHAGNIKALPYLGASSASMDQRRIPSLGSITNLSMGFEARKAPWLGIDFFLHTASSHPDGNHHELDFTGNLMPDGRIINAKGAPAFTNADYAKGGLLEKEGYAFHTGIRYPFDASTYLGAEFNYGSQYWWSATQGSEDMFNKLSLRGDAQELYILHNISRELMVRLGYLRMHETYTGSGWHFGKPEPKDGEQTNLYFLIDARF